MSPIDQPPRDSITGLFYKGKYAEAADRALLDADARFDAAETPAVVASLAAMGQLADAELLLTHQRELLSPGEIAFSLYHLAVAAISTGRYDVARRHLGRLFALRNQANDASSLFFVYQGIAYYRYATGRLVSAFRCAHRAGAFTRRSGFAYGSFLWNELLGHVQSLTGDIEAGLTSLQTAITFAQKLERHDSARALTSAAVMYAARYRQAPREAVQTLKTRLSETAPDERFARASLLLELARQQVLARQLAPVKATLATASRICLSLASRRYEAVLSLRLIDAMILENNLESALIITQTTQRLLNSEADGLLELELVARRRLLFKALDLTEAHAEATRRLAWLERRTGFLRPADPPLPASTNAPNARSPALNHRQITFLKDIRDGDMIDVHAYRKRFNVSEITACRDLAAMSRAKFLKRIGKARATRYALMQRPQN